MTDFQDTTAQEIPQGFCHCGCGTKTNLATITSKKFGRIKGQPMKYIAGHHLREKTGELNHGWKGGKHEHHGYTLIREPEHPRSVSGYVPEHILIAEKALGKFIKLPHVVHHHTPEQLVICENPGYHLLLHKRQRAYEACGNVHWLKCKYCKQYDDPENMFISGDQHYHRACKNSDARKRYVKK